jgi:hypothetical protein
MKNKENDFSGLIRFVEQKDLVLEKEVSDRRSHFPYFS